MASSAIYTQEKFLCDKFDINSVSSLSLFLYDHYSFLTAKDQNGKVLAVNVQTFSDLEELTVLLQNDDLYQIDLPTKVFVHNSTFSLVPGALFNTAFLNTYIAFAGDNTNVSTYESALQSNAIHLVGGISTDSYNKLVQGKGSVQFYHGAVSFLSYCLNEKPNLLNQEILIYYFDSHFYLAAFSNQELMVFNRFEAFDKEDILKYIFGVIQQLNFNRKLCRINFLGDAESMEINKVWGENYFKNFKISIPQSNIHYHEGPDKILQSPAFESRWEFI